MEGITLSREALTAPWRVIGGLSLLAIVVASVLFGYMAEEEKAARRLYWAEWPIPGTEESYSEERKLRLAA